MDRVLKKTLQLSLVLFDCIAINLMIPILIYVFQKNGYLIHLSQITYFSIATNLMWISIFNGLQLYDLQEIFEIQVYFLKLFGAFIVLLVAQLCLLYFYDVSTTLMLKYLYGYVLLVIILSSVRLVYVGLRQLVVRKQKYFSRAIIIGYNNTAKKLAEYLQRSTGVLQLVGYVDDAEKVVELSALPVYSGIANSIAIAKSLNINEIYSTINPSEHPELPPLVMQSEKACIRFHFVSNVSDFIERGMVVDHFHHLSICSLRSDPLTDVGNRLIKRIFDVVFSFFILVFILSWLFPFLALLIKLSSRGPILFKQLRSGLADKPFYCYKFRTMRMNSQADFKQATKNDTRTTWIGKILRKTSLDEFPQFINVLKGEMSVVGPRPHMLKHTHDFSQIADQYMVRHLLKPGITGWAQVNGYRGEIIEQNQIKKRIEYDVWYLENWSLYLDVKIIALTFMGLFKKDKNAY